MKRLSPAMIRMLKAARDTGNPYSGISGMSAHGGAGGTFYALKARGLLDAAGSITEEGRAALQSELNK